MLRGIIFQVRIGQFEKRRRGAQAVLLQMDKGPGQLNLKTAFEKAGQGCSALILLGDANPNRSHRISPAG